MSEKSKGRGYGAFAALALASICGARSLLPLAMLSSQLSRRRARRVRAAMGPGVWLSRPSVASALAIIALAELVADKSDGAPPRTAVVGLLARALTGGTVATAVGSSLVPAPIRFVTGAAAAVSAAFGAYYLRRRAREVGIGNAPAGLIEDAFSFAAAKVLLVTLRGRANATGVHDPDGHRLEVLTQR